MQLVYLIALLLVIVVLNWRFLGLDRITGFPRRDPNGCYWIRDDGRETGDGQRHWVCMSCGARTTTRNRRPPRDCLSTEDRT